jgi:hypothetical protein
MVEAGLFEIVVDEQIHLFRGAKRGHPGVDTLQARACANRERANGQRPSWMMGIELARDGLICGEAMESYGPSLRSTSACAAWRTDAGARVRG